MGKNIEEKKKREGQREKERRDTREINTDKHK